MSLNHPDLAQAAFTAVLASASIKAIRGNGSIVVDAIKIWDGKVFYLINE